MAARYQTRRRPISSSPEIKFKFKDPKISNTNVSDKMPYANSVEPSQTAPEGTV